MWCLLSAATCCHLPCLFLSCCSDTMLGIQYTGNLVSIHKLYQSQ